LDDIEDGKSLQVVGHDGRGSMLGIGGLRRSDLVGASGLETSLTGSDPVLPPTQYNDDRLVAMDATSLVFVCQTSRLYILCYKEQHPASFRISEFLLSV